MAWLVTTRWGHLHRRRPRTVVGRGVGGPGACTSAEVAGPYDAAVDGANLGIADTSSHRIQMVTG
jgi:hypothetical protein